MIGTPQLFKKFKETQDARQRETISFAEYLERCQDPSTYALAHGRMTRAIGAPKLIDTRRDERLGRIYQNRTLKIYETFSDFHGIEHVIEEVVSAFVRAEKGGEGAKQIIAMRGGPGSGKSSIMERLKALFQREPYYVLADEEGVISPIGESPLGMFAGPEYRRIVEDDLKIDPYLVPVVRTRWLQRRLEQYKGDFTRFRVVKLYPSVVDQIGITQMIPGDENTQDVSVLVGKTDIRKLDELSQDDPDAYVYSGALNGATNGMCELIELFKASEKLINPLYTATQDHYYAASEQIGMLPYNGILIAHFNDAEWYEFAQKDKNRALLDRTTTIRVPYCLRVSDEIKIYNKRIQASKYRAAACAPGTKELMAEFAVMTRLMPPKNSPLSLKTRVYDGENLSDKETSAKTIEEYRTEAREKKYEEGIRGVGVRFALKVLERSFEANPDENGTDAVFVLNMLHEQLPALDGYTDAEKDEWQKLLNDPLKGHLHVFLGNELREAFFSSQGGEFAQNEFERYFWLASHWRDKQDYRDPETGNMVKVADLDKELQKIEKPAGIANPKDYRSEVVMAILKYMATNNGKIPNRKMLPLLNNTIEKKVYQGLDNTFESMIERGESGTDEQKKTHNAFMEQMKKKGYTAKQTVHLLKWYQQNKISS
ncbi:MAG: PrkA family serine protein kinase [Parcubacteria group bacterium]|nr:PrkA family serine protein kinase [Parcubacteria group bacterium]